MRYSDDFIKEITDHNYEQGKVIEAQNKVISDLKKERADLKAELERIRDLFDVVDEENQYLHSIVDDLVNKVLELKLKEEGIII